MEKNKPEGEEFSFRLNFLDIIKEKTRVVIWCLNRKE